MQQLQNEVISISDEELRSLTDAIYLRHGIDFSCYEPKSLKRRVIRTLHIFRLKSAHDLWIKILKEQSFIYPFMDEVSVNLTAMFRDPILWKRISSLLLTELNKNPTLAIWHAGCSTGEEIYTMSIVLQESLHGKNAKVLATDISNQSIDVAKKGQYSLHKLNEYEENYRQYNSNGSLKKYYKENESFISLDVNLISHVSFENHNLITGSFTRKFDIIFCRNVMIYFDNQAKKKLFDKFYDSLNPKGLFIIGFYDAVLPLIDANKFQVIDMDAKIFRRL